MEGLNCTCAKCGNTQYEAGEFRAAGGFLSKVFDVQSKRFSTVTCAQYQYTEIYRTSSSMPGNVFDFFTGSWPACGGGRDAGEHRNILFFRHVIIKFLLNSGVAAKAGEANDR